MRRLQSHGTIIKGLAVSFSMQRGRERGKSRSADGGGDDDDDALYVSRCECDCTFSASVFYDFYLRVEWRSSHSLR